MNRHYDRYLCKKYPKLFRNRHASIRESCMAWGFDVGNGWFHIIYALCANIQNHINWSRKNRATALRFNRALHKWVNNKDDSWLRHYFTSGDYVNTDLIESAKAKLNFRKVPKACPQVTVDQVKEKFGTLRFYYSGGDETVDGMVRMAETMSSLTCEVCGNKGKLGGRGWYSTRCKDHSK